jgi:hypothetical protein
MFKFCVRPQGTPARGYGLAGMTALLFAGFNAATIAQANPTPSPRCTAYASAPWTPRPAIRSAATTFKIEAYSEGPTCEKAVVVFVIRSQTGDILFEHSYRAYAVMTTSYARTRAQMTSALLEWVTPTPDLNRAFFNDLTDWKAGADAPEPTAEEFGFYPYPSISRGDYLRIRATRPPVLCYVQGIESSNCLVFEQGEFTKFGAQTFPG